MGRFSVAAANALRVIAGKVKAGSCPAKRQGRAQGTLAPSEVRPEALSGYRRRFLLQVRPAAKTSRRL
jgi:hypothetical protein